MDDTYDSLPAELWQRAFLIRAFEERLLSLFAEGRLQGTVHTCSGQEWSALAAAAALRESDWVLSNHRGHGHFLARHPELLRPLLAEIMGLAEGLSGGVGGSQHLYAGRFLSNGVQGGMVPVAAGLALAEKLRDGNGVAAVFIGDGTTGEGAVYEAMNLAGVRRLPLLIILERNGFAQSTPTAETIAGSIAARAEGFGFSCFKGGVWTPAVLCAAAREAVSAARRSGPALLEIECFRLNAHSKGDDDRPADLLAAFRQKDPLAVFTREYPGTAEEFSRRAEAAVEEALSGIGNAPCTYTPAPAVRNSPVRWEKLSLPSGPPVRYGEKIHQALRQFLSAGPEAVLLGEDITAPYGGAFKITRNLSLEFPDQVLRTPISEAAIAGAAAGLALAGMKPAAEIMFGDFLTLIFDQLQQHAAKFAAFSGGRLKVPLLVRTPSGGRRGYGPTHSQSLEKHFLGIPGLTVAALNARLGPAEIFRRLADADGPGLIIENKVLYTRPFQPPLPGGCEAFLSAEPLPTLLLRPAGSRADVTVVCYGGMLEQAEEALAGAFYEDEILCEIVCCSCLHPLNAAPVFESLKRTGRLLTAEEGPGFAGFGAEIMAQVLAAGIPLRGARRLAYDGIIPASAQREAELLPSAADIRQALRELAGGEN